MLKNVWTKYLSLKIKKVGPKNLSKNHVLRQTNMSQFRINLNQKYNFLPFILGLTFAHLKLKNWDRICPYIFKLRGNCNKFLSQDFF